jgi:hypothetical protein
MIDAPTPLRWGSAMLLALCSALPSAQAEVIVRGEEGFPLHEARPAPTSLQPDFALVVAQPSPSEVNPSFLGPVLLMKSAHVDLEAGTATVPLREGQLPDGRKVWFIITDVSDRDLAELHGVPYSAKMAYGLTGDAYREASIETDGTWTFADGTVDFAPEWSVTPGEAPNFFPPTAAQPGSVGDAAYSPLVSITNAGKGITFNAPMIAFDRSADELNAFCDGAPDHAGPARQGGVGVPARRHRHDRADAGLHVRQAHLLHVHGGERPADRDAGAGHPSRPALAGLPFANEDAAPGESAERIYVFANGPSGIENPQRQGVNSVLGGDGRGPLNVLGGIPTINLDYSPMWRLFPPPGRRRPSPRATARACPTRSTSRTWPPWGTSRASTAGRCARSASSSTAPWSTASTDAGPAGRDLAPGPSTGDHVP